MALCTEYAAHTVYEPSFDYIKMINLLTLVVTRRMYCHLNSL
jgi:hypothetical protein